MRKKSITVFLCVYAALCISYCVVSSGMVPDNDDIIAVSAGIQTVSEATSFPSSDSKIDAYETKESSENDTVLSEQYNTVTENSTEPPQETIQGSDDGQQSEEQTEEESEDESVEDKPSLEEFLRGLRCSGCRHNCTLLSPRCMNGSKKASQAESQYYQMYM